MQRLLYFVIYDFNKIHIKYIQGGKYTNIHVSASMKLHIYTLGSISQWYNNLVPVMLHKL